MQLDRPGAAAAATTGGSAPSPAERSSPPLPGSSTAPDPSGQSPDERAEPAPDALRPRIAVLIASRNGEATIVETIGSAIAQADVYVVSDGSTDQTAHVANAAGAHVLAGSASVGKAGALRAGVRDFSLVERYDFITILDDDTTVAPDYLERATSRMLSDPAIAATSGRIDSRWERRHRWNPFIAMRAFTYWSYQFTVKRSQNVLHVVNVVCGANSVFRAGVFGELITVDPPYAIDDMYWLAEIVRSGLGRVAYAHDARSWTIDPHRFGDWYRQTVRWCWGQFQSIRGHRLGCPLRRDRRRLLGVRVSWFDVAYLALLLDFLPYMAELLVLPVLAYTLRGWINPLWFGLFFVAGSVLWIAVAAAALRKPRLVVLAPLLIALDLVYRVAMLHALVKTIAKPRVEAQAWASPPRFALERVASGD